ncbi:MAG TPA: ankyrin repeat domain-containing protein [Polyangiales bacterium]|nr:ankyrin repeat domain-containing protein [Polyangiales bacterium]
MSFEALRKSAKRWLKSIKSGDATALARLRELLPGASPTPGLREVQQALAREHGHESWAALKEHHETAALTSAESVREYLRCACLSYTNDDWPSKWRRAERLRERRPELARADIHTAAVSGELERVRELLRTNPALASARGGSQHWPPLLFVCYGRVQNPAALDVARLLLDTGADPNAHFAMDDCHFSALTGVIGQGELGQPEHPQAEALAQLLLARGAKPDDAQALYNTHLEGDDPRWLEILSRFGLDRGARVNWLTRQAKPPKSFDYLLPQAAGRGHVRRLRWLLEHGADPNARSTYTGKSCYQTALLGGETAIAALLLEHGARAEPLTGRDAFVAACARNDDLEARRLLEGHPDYLQVHQPLIDAAQSGKLDYAALLLRLGMDPNGRGVHGHHALHVSCEQRAMSELLLQHGADPRSRCFGGSVTGWALHARDLDSARYHAERSRSLLDAAASGHVALARELLAADPACVQERSPNGDTALHELPDELDAAVEVVSLLLAHGADPQARNQAGQTPAEKLEARGLPEHADLIEAG